MLSGITLGVVCPMANEIDSAEAFVNPVLHHCKGIVDMRLPKRIVWRHKLQVL
jgi:hypothetical protein